MDASYSEAFKEVSSVFVFLYQKPLLVILLSDLALLLGPHTSTFYLEVFLLDCFIKLTEY